MFQGDPLFNIIRLNRVQCAGAGGQQGTCYSRLECSSLQGTISGKCAYNWGVCCISKYIDVCQTGALGLEPLMLVNGCTFHVQTLYGSFRWLPVYKYCMTYILFHKRCCSSTVACFLQFIGHVTHLRKSIPHISPTPASLRCLRTCRGPAPSQSPRLTPIFAR
jgi:hypothetical protein